MSDLRRQAICNISSRSTFISMFLHPQRVSIRFPPESAHGGRFGPHSVPMGFTYVPLHSHHIQRGILPGLIPIPFNGATVLARLTAWRLDAYARCAV